MRVLSALKGYMASKRRYFVEGRREIAADNARFLRLAAIMVIVLLAVLLVSATFLISDWQPSPYHIAFLPASISVCAICWLGLRHAAPWGVTALCILFEVFLYTFAILLDTVGGPSNPSIFVQLVCVALTGLFILPDRFGLGLFALAEAVYCVLVVTVKDPKIAQFDLFGMVTGILFSLCLSRMVISFRLRSYDVKARYERLSTRDTLSNLYNRRAFMERARSYIGSMNPEVSCSLAFIDLDDFKDVNDSHGHQAGDCALTELGRLLSEQFRPSDIIARYGGDEFLVLLDGLVDDAVLQKRFTRIREEFARRSKAAIGQRLTCSVGVVCARSQDVSLEGLMMQADNALYTSKRNGKNSICIKTFDPSLKVEHGEHLG